MAKKEKIESLLSEYGFTEYRWITPQEIKVSQWVRVKCMFGCSDYGHGTCPPNTPNVEECRAFFKEYYTALLIKLDKFADKTAYPSDWSKEMTNKLLELEKQVFLSGNPKAFLLNQTCCGLCKECSNDRENCEDKERARPSPEAFAVDVYQTVQSAGLEINVISENPSDISRIAILMVD
jgi:predicted metal-binding protein